MKQIKQPRFKKIALDLGMKVIGCTALYWLGQGAGELMDHIPGVREYVPQLMEYISGVDFTGNLNGLMGCVGIAAGLKASGIETEFQEMESGDLYHAMTGQEPPENEVIVSLNLGGVKLEDKVNGYFS